MSDGRRSRPKSTMGIWVEGGELQIRGAGRPLVRFSLAAVRIRVGAWGPIFGRTGAAIHLENGGAHLRVGARDAALDVRFERAAPVRRVDVVLDRAAFCDLAHALREHLSAPITPFRHPHIPSEWRSDEHEPPLFVAIRRGPVPRIIPWCLVVLGVLGAGLVLLLFMSAPPPAHGKVTTNRVERKPDPTPVPVLDEHHRCGTGVPCCGLRGQPPCRARGVDRPLPRHCGGTGEPICCGELGEAPCETKSSFVRRDSP